MPLREPRMNEDLEMINDILGTNFVAMSSVYRFVSGISITGCLVFNDVYVYKRGYVDLEDTSRRPRKCVMMSIWSSPIEEADSECLFQQPIPIKLRIN